jgi:hypothetical protein
MTDPFDIIHEGCYLGMRFGMDISATPTGNLEVVEGVYGFAGGKAYHPLEAILTVVSVASSDWRADAATTLGVEPAWVRGFLDGFAQMPEESRDGEYIQGFLVAEQLRTMRYRRELPDK